MAKTQEACGEERKAEDAAVITQLNSVISLLKNRAAEVLTPPVPNLTCRFCAEYIRNMYVIHALECVCFQIHALESTQAGKPVVVAHDMYQQIFTSDLDSARSLPDQRLPYQVKNIADNKALGVKIVQEAEREYEEICVELHAAQRWLQVLSCVCRAFSYVFVPWHVSRCIYFSFINHRYKQRTTILYVTCFV
jgi:hypothetical protein